MEDNWARKTESVEVQEGLAPAMLSYAAIWVSRQLGATRATLTESTSTSP